jgi:hypothetical protein
MSDQEANASDEKDAKKEEAAKKPKKEEITDPVVLGRKLQGLALELGHYQYENAATDEEQKAKSNHITTYWEKSPINQGLEVLGKGLSESAKSDFQNLSTGLKAQCDDWAVGYEFDKDRWDKSFEPLKETLKKEAGELKEENKVEAINKKIQELDTFAKEKHLEQQRKLQEQWERSVDNKKWNQMAFHLGYLQDSKKTIWERVGSQEIPEDNAAARMVSQNPNTERLNKIRNEQKEGDWYKRKDSEVYLKLEKNMISVHYRGDFIGNGNFNKAYGEALDFLALVRGAKTIVIEWPDADLQRAGGTVSRRVSQIEKILKIAAEKGLKVELGDNAKTSLSSKVGKLDAVLAAIKKHNEPLLRKEKMPEDLVSVKNQATDLKKQFAGYTDKFPKATDADLSSAYARALMEPKCKSVEDVSKQIALIGTRLATVKKSQEGMTSHHKILDGCERQYSDFREQLTKVLDELKTQTTEHFDDLKIRVNGLRELVAHGTAIKEEDKKSLSTFGETIKALQSDIDPKQSAQDEDRASASRRP